MADTDLDFATLNNLADPTFNQLLGINNNDQIVGYFGSGATGHPNKGYTLDTPYAQQNYTGENFPNSVQTQVTGVNSFGTNVGFWADSNNANGQNNNFGFVRQGANYTNVVDPAGQGKAANGLTVEQLLGVNDFNEAVGFWTDADGNNHGFTYNINTKQFTDDNLGFVNLTETAINNKHETAGFLTAGNGQTIGFIKNPNSVFPVPVFGPAGATSTQVLGLNDFDQAVGMYTDSNGSTHGFLFDEFKNLYYTIDSPFAMTGKGSSTVLNGINDRFQAVGFYLDPAGHTDGLLVNIRDTSLSI